MVVKEDIILKAENISKQYRLGVVGTGTISHDLNRWWNRVRGKEDPYLKIGESNDRSTKGSSEYVWALQDINFEVKRGEVLGIIGKNGAGKSTLLKILSKVTGPTTGEIKTKGRIASLLEVGTGFHGEMTGRENIFLNGAILGMTKKEITAKIDEIIEFSGCQRYIDTPVKRYSSGMTVRLAFAVAAFLEPEILVIDEVLAVGDAEFQKKAIGKMQDISSGDGRTVLFVSHNMAAVKSLCTRCVVLDNGTITYSGETNQAVEKYLKIDKEVKCLEWERVNISQQLNIENVKILLKGTQPTLKLKVDVIINGDIDNLKDTFMFAMNISNGIGQMVGQTLPSLNLFTKNKGEKKNYSFLISLNGFVPDTYYLSVWIGKHFTHTHDWVKRVVNFEIIDSPQVGRTFPHPREHGSIVLFSEII